MKSWVPIVCLCLMPFLLCSCGTESSRPGSSSSPSSGSSRGSTTDPTFHYTAEGGCYDVELWKSTADGREILRVFADAKSLMLPRKGSIVFDLAEARSRLTVTIDQWDGRPETAEFCGDAMDPHVKKIDSWVAKAGKLTITTADSDDKAHPKRYRATAELEEVVFKNSAGREVTLHKETISADVGWNWKDGS